MTAFIATALLTALAVAALIDLVIEILLDPNEGE